MAYLPGPFTDEEYEAMMSEADETNSQPRHISVQAGDKIWVLRSRVTLKPNKELSSEDMEVIDVEEK